jgi:parallel beta-helix repeat protein
VIGDNSSFGNTIYVDDDGGADYTKIQDALDAAEDGDTVFVYRGTYIENLRVNQSINLIGEDRDTTIIDGSEKNFPVWISTIIIRADSVNVRGFTILNEKGFSCGIFIGMNHNENVIVDNNIIFPWKGIWLSESRNNIIKENIISDAWDGIYLEGSEDNVITDNILFMNGISGISLNDANNNIITGNVIRKNIFGICCWNSIGNKISGNNIDSNEEFGIQIEYSFLNIISANNIINNTLDAYFLHFLSLQNRWDSNYWGKKYLIKPIFGEFWILFSNPGGGIESLRIPLVKFDKHPAKEPYDI